MANSAIEKYIPNPALDRLSNPEDLAILPARSFITRSRTTTGLWSRNTPKMTKKNIYKVHKKNGQYPAITDLTLDR